MGVVFRRAGASVLLALSAVAASAQSQQPDPSIIVNGRRAPAGPEIKGVISARNGDRIKVVAADGTSTIIGIDGATRVSSASGLFNANRNRLEANALLTGPPVTVKTLQSGEGPGGELVASQITFRKTDLRFASMIRNGTDQRFEEQAAATESLRGRMADIDKYNVKSTTNVHFDTGKAVLSDRDKADLCTTATSAQGTENALILVVGYTDSTGNDDFNQDLSEKRAGRVINYLQQACGWKPYRMLTPTGMAKADPLASNATAEGKARNRRVAVNILVSKSVDGF